MMSYPSLVFTDGVFTSDLEMVRTGARSSSGRRILPKKCRCGRDGDWFILGLVWSCFCRSFVFRGGVFGCCHFWVVSGGGFGRRRGGGRRGSFSFGIWLKLLVVFGVGSCWLFEVEVGSLVRCYCWFIGEHGNGVVSGSFGSGFWWFWMISPVEFFGAAGCYYCCRWQQTKREGKEAWVFGSGVCIARASPNSGVVVGGNLMNSETFYE
ncbi:hypothetical protein KY284_030092 [Solanum tuberosum]|nr:hypothetical protein KY284_030092 [Solanum tuberosum]